MVRLIIKNTAHFSDRDSYFFCTMGDSNWNPGASIDVSKADFYGSRFKRLDTAKNPAKEDSRYFNRPKTTCQFRVLADYSASDVDAIVTFNSVSVSDWNLKVVR